MTDAGRRGVRRSSIRLQFECQALAMVRMREVNHKGAPISPGARLLIDELRVDRGIAPDSPV